MIYYRIAVHTKHMPTWRWMTTKLTSLHAVLNFLQTYRCPAHAHLRIFFACSIEALDDMLAAENRGDASFSVTPEHLLSGGQTLANEPTARGLALAQQRTLTTTASVDALHEPEAPVMPLAESTSTALEARRLEMELGTGGDHNQPYRFAFPPTLPETCAWMRLRKQVQCGNLEL